jgi:hypothetical protein
MRVVTTLLFAAAMTLAGFLLFQVQPVMAKFILPWFGGSATTWTVCMLFFQLALLAGYAYVYAVSLPFTVRQQAVAQIVLLVVAILCLPITPSDIYKPADAHNPIGRIMLLLTICVGVPYAVLSTTSPLLQRWLAQTDPGMLTSRFFALSNFGSFLGLLSYPFLFERVWSSPEQTRYWSWSFVIFAALVAVASLLILRQGAGAKKRVEPSTAAAPADGSSHLALWIFYSALGSVLLLATTNQITQWTAVVPFLWILPLSLYLVTFIIAFGHQSFYDRLWFCSAFAVLLLVTMALSAPDSSASLLLQVGLQSLTMFLGCMICHGEMVRLQPEPARLPRFYLAVAVGGALGGVIVTLLAPLVFQDYFEHQIALTLTGLVGFTLAIRSESAMRRQIAIGFAMVFAAGVALAGELVFVGEQTVVDRIRNFYGVVKVVRDGGDDPQTESLTMVQAGVPQGSQYLAPEKRQQPYCAFLPHSGIGRTLANVKKRRLGGPDAPLRIGSVGLGVGVLAALGKAGDDIRVYELNPAVTELTNKHFTFVKDSKSKVEIEHGDGRILLERELQAGQRQNYDVIVVDAFRGASPPLHLMTAEAFDIYLRHLAPDGVLAINFELDTFDMAPLHRGLADRFGLNVGWFETPDEGNDCDDTVSWALYTKDADFMKVPDVAQGLSPWRDGKDTRLVWTDANANLMSIISWDKIMSAAE